MTMTHLHISPAGKFNSSLIPPGLVRISKSNLNINQGHLGLSIDNYIWN